MLSTRVACQVQSYYNTVCLFLYKSQKLNNSFWQGKNKKNKKIRGAFMCSTSVVANQRPEGEKKEKIDSVFLRPNLYKNK